MISQTDAAKLAGVSRQRIFAICKKIPAPRFVVEMDGKKYIDEKHATWTQYVESGKIERIKNKITKPEKEKKKKEKSEKHKPQKNQTEQPQQKDPAGEIKTDIENASLLEKATIAEYRKKIHFEKIAGEKAKQEEIRTHEMKRELAPISLVKHFFSFAENMIQRIYRRPHEISPDLAALFMAGEEKKAVQKIIRELEAIIKDSVQELKDEIKKEGYKT